MIKWFDWHSLPTELHDAAQPFQVLATHLEDTIPPGPERTVAFRKLLEARDCTFRAIQLPGG